MKNIGLLILLSVLFVRTPAQADDLFGDSSLDFDTLDTVETDNESSWRRQDAPTEKVLSDFLASRISNVAARNIENAEKVFCYTVDYATPEYKGYTLNDMAIKGSCGELSAEGKSLIKDVLLGNNAAYSSNTERCEITPKILLRFIYGLDSTDVLFSVPCHSLTFFQGRNIITVNAAPGKEIIEQIVNAYVGLEEKFLSPALLGQMVANGQAITQDQKEIERKLNAAEPVKKWNSGNTTPASQPAQNTGQSAPTAKKGWNKLK